MQFAGAASLTATTQGSTQTTGAAQVLGLPPGYQTAFPGELRLLSGSLNGVLVAQQTASNLHVAPGSTVTIARPGTTPANVTVAGVVDLPYVDSLFQKVGAPPGRAGHGAAGQRDHPARVDLQAGRGADPGQAAPS